jgi:ATP-dependent DNA helicase RecQ
VLRPPTSQKAPCLSRWSITSYQPAISFVVAPIKSLMTDQINNIREKHHVTHVNYINSDLTPEQASQFLSDFSKGKYFFLIISPDRFQSKGFREQLSMINYTKAISIAVIDEVHCLSEWGHDFRTSYLALANSILQFTPFARFLALTATASSKVLQDIMNELDITPNNVITISNFTRDELHFNFITTPKKLKHNQLMEYIRSIFQKNDETKGPALVFTQTVNGENGCYKLSHSIQAWTGLRTGFYSGSTPNGYYSTNFSKEKDVMQHKFMRDEIDVLVATKAFGMGIDKGNIRHTIHFGIPNSLESFYQEAGRAGRDKHPSNCIVLYSPDSLTNEQMQTIFGINTKQELLKNEQKKLSGDLNTLLFSLSTNLMDIEDEIEEIYDFYQFNFSSGNREVVIDFHNDQ